MNRRHFILSTASLALITAFGCQEDGDRHESRRRRRSEENLGRDRDVDYDLDLDRGGRQFDEVPRGAKQINPDRDGRLKYEAGRDGRVFIVDEDDGVVVFSANLRDGEKVVVDPDNDRLTINGKRVGKINLRARNRYLLFFDRRE